MANSEPDTVVIFRDRVAEKSVSEEVAEISGQSGATFADVADLASGVRGRTEVPAGGDVEGGMWWASQAQELSDSVVPVAEVVSTIVGEAERLLQSLPGSLVD